ncbi:Ankyrin repeat domain-containing protein 50 [Hondaea fermentalgiana]|uniref:Ankyrin repeat domain-containing protein 50 n=1 Tax=Hondaea fermentalgiana TaxID=2315210 RepID=A0A2R5G7L4_9STRA|nr:Ankyrin repeat domain-containing protein 50 [Hondaea fermentalgiana]|eukprot:GBG25788.1 Ankyrin repeat domain-containing protein 50 [Hondaea fermentalgiana]
MTKDSVPSAKDLKACAKLLKQTKKEAKVLEGLALLSKAKDHVATFMDEGAALVPLAALIDASKLSEHVVELALVVLARYLGLDGSNAHAYVAQGQTKKSSPCRGVDRFIKLLGHENPLIVQNSLQCLGSLATAVSTLEDGTESLATVSLRCADLVQSDDAPVSVRVETLSTLLHLVLAGAEPSPILDAVLRASTAETAPPEIQDASTKILYEASILPTWGAQLVGTTETASLTVSLFEAAAKRLTDYAPAKGESPEDTEIALVTAAEGAKSALLVFVWTLAHLPEETNLPQPDASADEDTTEASEDTNAGNGTAWAPSAASFEAFIALLNSKREGVVDLCLASLPQLPVKYLKELASRDAANVLLTILNERRDPDLIQAEEETSDEEVEARESKQASDASAAASVLEESIDAPAKVQEVVSLNDTHTKAQSVALPLEYGLHQMLINMEVPDVKIDILKVAIARAPLEATRIIMRLLNERQAKVDLDAYEAWYTTLVKEGLFHALVQAMGETDALEAAIRGITLLEDLARWNADPANQTALKEPIAWEPLFITVQSACNKHLETVTHCFLIEPTGHPSPRPIPDDSRWEPKDICVDDVEDDVFACAYRLLCAAAGADDARASAAAAEAQEGETSPSPPPRFFDSALLAEEVKFALFTVDGLARAVANGLTRIQLTSLRALRALAGLEGGRSVLLSQLLVARRERSEKDQADNEDVDPGTDAKDSKAPRETSEEGQDSDQTEKTPRFVDHVAGETFAVMQETCALLAKVLYDVNQHDSAVQSAVQALFALCKQASVTQDWEQPLDADLFCAATLRASVLPCLVAFTACETLGSDATGLARYLILRGSCRENAWKTWEEPQMDEEGNPVLDEAGEPVMVTQGPGEDPNHGPNLDEWAPFLNQVSHLIRHGSRTQHLPQVDAQTAVTVLARQPELDASVELVQHLITAGAELENATASDGITSLMWAAANGNEKIARVLLQSGRTDVDAVDNSGCNVCYWAFAGGKILPLLLEFNVDVNISLAANGSYPLHWVSQGVSHEGFASEPSVYTGWLDALIRHGAEVDLVDQRGRSPLHDAVSHGQTGAALDLLRAGADPNIVDQNGNLALHLACQGENVDLLEQLLALGNKRPLVEGVFHDHGRGCPVAKRTAFRVDRALNAGLEEILRPKIICDHVVSRKASAESDSESADVASEESLTGRWTQRAEMLKVILGHPAVDAHALVFEHTTLVLADAQGLAPLHYVCHRLPSIAVAQRVLDVLSESVVDSGSDKPTPWEVPEDLDVDPFILVAPRREENETSIELFSWLLEHGARFSSVTRAQAPRPELPECLTGTPLTVTTIMGELVTVQILLGCEAIELDAKEVATGRTALHLACLHGHTDIAIYLAVSGADVEVADDENSEVALFFCVRGAQLASLKELVGSSEEPGVLYGQLHASNDDGDSPLLLAERLNMGPGGEAYDEVVRFLLEVSPGSDGPENGEYEEKEEPAAAEKACADAEKEKQEQALAATKIQAVHRGRTQRLRGIRKHGEGGEDDRDEDDKSRSKKKGKNNKKKGSSSSDKKKKKKKEKA